MRNLNMQLQNKRDNTKTKTKTKNKFKFKTLMVAGVMLLSSCGTVSEYNSNGNYGRTKDDLRNATKGTTMERDMPETGTISIFRIEW